jgi:isopentenyldiphosphate isomerase
MDYKWVNMEELKSDIQKNKNNYTPWFIEIFKKFY